MSSSLKIVLRSVLVMAAIVILLWPLNATADGTHKATFRIKNCVSSAISYFSCAVYVFNGNDQCGPIPHKIYNVDKGSWKTGKCHGRGNGRCWVKVINCGTMAEFTWDALATCYEVPKGENRYIFNEGIYESTKTC